MIFSPSRFSVARKRRMRTQKDLADRIGVNPNTISRWEKGDVTPNQENISALARVLRFSEEYFKAGEIDEPEGAAVSFRSQKSMNAAIRDAALSAGSLGFLISDWVQEQFDLPEVSLPDLHLFEAESAAMTLRQEWVLGAVPISNMIQLLESKGVRVFSLAENTSKVNAYSLWRNGVPYVFLNTYKSAECSRFDAAHELAHLVLHQDCQVSGRQAEDQGTHLRQPFDAAG